jgi:hypothetical protein
MGRPFIDITNQRFGKLIATSYTGKDNSKAHHRLWDCLCDCGNTKIVAYRRLVSGNTTSCGCIALSGLIGGGHNKLDSGMARFNDLYVLYTKSAKKRGHEFHLTKPQFHILTQGNCHYCGRPPSQVISAGKECNGDFVYNGIDRIDSDLGYTIENTRSCCKQCNISKNTLTEQEFYAWLERVAIQISINSPRLLAAYEAAKQARF